MEHQLVAKEWIRMSFQKAKTLREYIFAALETLYKQSGLSNKILAYLVAATIATPPLASQQYVWGL